MWQYYRKTFLFIQLFILSLLVVMHFIFKVPLIGLLPYLAIMEVGSLLGAAWSMRLRRKILTRRGEWPGK